MRDALTLMALDALGWQVLIVWECEVSDLSALTRKVTRWADREGQGHGARCAGEALRDRGDQRDGAGPRDMTPATTPFTEAFSKEVDLSLQEFLERTGGIPP